MQQVSTDNLSPVTSVVNHSLISNQVSSEVISVNSMGTRMADPVRLRRTYQYIVLSLKFLKIIKILRPLLLKIVLKIINILRPLQALLL